MFKAMGRGGATSPLVRTTEDLPAFVATKLQKKTPPGKGRGSENYENVL